MLLTIEHMVYSVGLRIEIIRGEHIGSVFTNAASQSLNKSYIQDGGFENLELANIPYVPSVLNRKYTPNKRPAGIGNRKADAYNIINNISVK